MGQIKNIKLHIVTDIKRRIESKMPGLKRNVGTEIKTEDVGEKLKEIKAEADADIPEVPLKKKRKKKKNTQNPKATTPTEELSEERRAELEGVQIVRNKVDCTSITPNSKGFLISFKVLQPGSEFCSQLVAEATALFESYSKKLDPPVDCYFKEQMVGKKDESPIFIETDMVDPAVLLHAVFEDLMKSGNREGVEKLSMCRMMPVHATWEVSLESEKGKYMTREEYANIEQEVNTYIDKYVEEGKGASFQVQAWNRSIEKCITEHLLSKGAVRVAKDGVPDVVVYVKLYGAKVFCLSLLTDFAKYKDYNMKKILENKEEDMVPS